MSTKVADALRAREDARKPKPVAKPKKVAKVVAPERGVTVAEAVE